MKLAARSNQVAGGTLRKAAVVGSFCVLALTAAAPPPASTEVTAVRFWTLDNVVRIAVETKGEVSFRHERLHNPERVFFDLANSRSRLGRKGFQSFPVGDRLVKQIRVAQTKPNVTRIVIDLSGEVELSASKLANPSRLMIELRPVVTATPRAPATPRPDSKPSTPVKEVAVEPPKASPVPEVKPAQTPPAAPVPVAAAELTPAKPAAVQPAPAAVPAKKNSRGERSLTRVLGLKMGRVVIDAGHGGHDHGSTGPTGLAEKDLVLDIAKRLGALIEDQLGSEVVYTRTDDTFVPLETRTQIANDAKADLFLSVHANSSPLKYVTGVETYYLNFTTSKSALEVAARENATSQKSIHELQSLLQKIALKDKAEESREFAAKVQDSLSGSNSKTAGRSRNRGVKKAPFVVLIGASMPSVLVEVGFISNARDEASFKKPEQRQRVAEALFRGVSQYAGTLSHFQVAQTKTP